MPSGRELPPFGTAQHWLVEGAAGGGAAGVLGKEEASTDGDRNSNRKVQPSTGHTAVSISAAIPLTV